jgi:hypothetical protein
MGYSVVIWVDSINRLEKSLAPILPTVAQVGVYLQDKHPSGLYANDRFSRTLGCRGMTQCQLRLSTHVL